MSGNIKGRVWKFGDNVNTDTIVPGRYLNTSDPEELARHCMEDTDKEDFKEALAGDGVEGDFIVAGEMFGSGSSREHAPVAIKYAGISAVIAKSFASIFYKNAINLGFYPLICPEAVDGCEQGDFLEINVETGTILNMSRADTYQAKPLNPRVLEVVRAGGLMPYVKGMLAEE